jgi:putative transposase
MIDPKHELPVTRQAELVGISRAAVYYVPRPVSEADLELQRRIDALHLEHPFAGSRLLKKLLRREGVDVGRKHVATLMRRMGIEALYRKKNTSKRHPGHAIYPYLLRNVAIERANQVWALDITYIPMRRGFVYFCAVMDWASRKILAHRLSNTLTADFCVEALEEAITRHGVPEIVNTDQGSQFTGFEFIDKLKRHGIAISMDGKGAWRDNVFIERFWKTLKYEEVYLRAYDTVSEARASIAHYMAFYNMRRPHSSIGDQTPDEAYFGMQAMKAAA